VRLFDPIVQQERLQRDGFVWPLLRRFSDSLKMVFGKASQSTCLAVVSVYVMYVYDKAIGGNRSTRWPSSSSVAGGGRNGLRLRHCRAAAIARLGARFDALAATEPFRRSSACRSA
jgi:hypothetical protein